MSNVVRIDLTKKHYNLASKAWFHDQRVKQRRKFKRYTWRMYITRALSALGGAVGLVVILIIKGVV